MNDNVSSCPNNIYRNGSYPRRGEIYYIKKGNTTSTGSETWSNRHAIIVSNNSMNRKSNVVQVVYITTQPKNNQPTHIDISTENLNRIAQCEQVTPVDKSRIAAYKGYLKHSEMQKINHAIKYGLAL